MARKTWTDEREALLVKLVQGGEHSFGMMANEIGCTRNAAIGKARRLGLQLSSLAIAENKRAGQLTEQPKQEKMLRRRPKLYFAEVDHSVTTQTVEEKPSLVSTYFKNNKEHTFVAEAITWIEESSRTIACWDCFQPKTMCAWPVRNNPFQFCGQPRSKNDPKSRYCDRHINVSARKGVAPVRVGYYRLGGGR